MQGAIDTVIGSPAAELHASHSEEVVEQPASNTSPPAMPLIEAKDLKVIGDCGLVPSIDRNRRSEVTLRYFDRSAGLESSVDAALCHRTTWHRGKSINAQKCLT